MKHLPLWLACFVALGLNANATDWFVLPEGNGQQDGTSWEQAVAASKLESLLNERMQPGDTLKIGSGEYRDFTLSVSVGGTAGKPKSIVGVDRGQGYPIFTAAWNVDKPATGQTAIKLGPAASHLTFAHLRLRGYAFGVIAPTIKDGPAREQLSLDDVDIEQFRYGFYLSDISHLRITNCDLKRYTKHGFRLDQGCKHVLFEHCTADCSTGDADWENKTEVFPFGFSVNDAGKASSDIQYVDCLATNNLKPNQTQKYKNGDGFVIEGNTRNVSLTNCRSIRNQDGGYDLKVPDVKVTNCVAIGNKRGFRIWSTGTLTNCFSGWNSNAALWTNGSEVAATRCTFLADQAFAILADDKAVGPIRLQSCLIALSGTATGQRASGKATFDSQETITTGPKQQTEDPKFLQPDPKWNGLGDALNSRTYPAAGYVGAKSDKK